MHRRSTKARGRFRVRAIIGKEKRFLGMFSGAHYGDWWNFLSQCDLADLNFLRCGWAVSGSKRCPATKVSSPHPPTEECHWQNINIGAEVKDSTCQCLLQLICMYQVHLYMQKLERSGKYYTEPALALSHVGLGCADVAAWGHETSPGR